MKAVAVAALTVGVGVVGANMVLSSDAAPEGAKNCWSDSKIKKDRFSLRGAEGTIRSFEIDKVEGCVFRVKVEYSTAMGSAKVLDYDAEYAGRDRPIFIRYHTPP